MKLIDNIRLLIVLLEQQNKGFPYFYPCDVIVRQSFSRAAVVIGLNYCFRPFFLLLPDGLAACKEQGQQEYD